MSKNFRVVMTILFGVLASATLFTACDETSDATGIVSSDPQISIFLNVDFAGRSDNISYEVDLPDNSTVIEVLVAAQDNGQLKFDSRGRGETSFVKSINGIQNEKSDGSNWIFFVNDELADEGCGTFNLRSNDKVMWKFAAEYLE